MRKFFSLYVASVLLIMLYFFIMYILWNFVLTIVYELPKLQFYEIFGLICIIIVTTAGYIQFLLKITKY